MARTFARPVPLPAIPQRPQFDGMAMGKEFADTIRRNKTIGAINKALEQHGTLSSPAAIETVRQNMGTWFSDPEKIIELQDNLFTMEKGLREEGRKDRERNQADALLDIQERQVAVTEAQQVAAEAKALVEQEQFDTTDKFRRDELQVTKDRYAATITQLEAATDLAREKHEIDTLTTYINKEVEWITIEEARIQGLMTQYGADPVWESHLRLLKEQRDELTGRLESVVNRTETDFPIDPLSEEFLRAGKSPVSLTEEYDPLPSTAALMQTRREERVENMSHESFLEFLPDTVFNRREPSDRFKETLDDLRSQERKLQTERTRPETPKITANIKRLTDNIKGLNETLYKMRGQEKETLFKKMRLTEDLEGNRPTTTYATREGILGAPRADVKWAGGDRGTVSGTLTDAALEKLSIKFGVSVEDIKQELDL